MQYNLSSFYTIQDLCRHYRVSARTLNRWLKNGVFNLTGIKVANNKTIFSGYEIAMQDGILQYKLANDKNYSEEKASDPCYYRNCFYTIEETAAILRTSSSCIKKLIEKGYLKTANTTQRKNAARIFGWDIAKFSRVDHINLPGYEVEDED